MPIELPLSDGLPHLDLGESRTNGGTSYLNVAVVEARVAMRYSYDNGYTLAPSGKKLLIVKYVVRNSAPYEVRFSRIDSGILLKAPDGKFVKHTGSVNNLPQPAIRARGSIEDTVWFYVPKDQAIDELFIRKGVEIQPLSLKKKIEVEPCTFLTAEGAGLDEVDGAYESDADLGPWDLDIDPMKVSSSANGSGLSPNSEEVVVMVPFTVRSQVSTAMVFGRGSILIEAVDASGTATSKRQAILDAHAHDPLSTTITKNKSVRGNFVFLAPQGMQIAFLRVTDPLSGRTIRYRVSNAANIR